MRSSVQAGPSGPSSTFSKTRTRVCSAAGRSPRPRRSRRWERCSSVSSTQYFLLGMALGDDHPRSGLQHKDHRFTPDKTLVHFYGSDSFGSGSSVSRANWLVAFASMSHSCFTWRGFLRDSRSSPRLSVERPSALFPSPSLKVACVNAKPTGRRNRWHKVNGARTSGSLLEGVDATVEASKINDATVHSW